MLKLKRAAVTGGLSCGKSSVCRILSELGAYVVSADKIVHQLLSSDANLGQEIVHLLGPSVLVNQTLDRSRIAHIVFHDSELLKALEALVHPAGKVLEPATEHGLRVQAVAVRIHGDDRRKIIHAQMPHRLRRSEFHEMHAQHFFH